MLKHIKIIQKDLVILLIVKEIEKQKKNNFYLQYQNNQIWKIVEKVQKKIKYQQHNKQHLKKRKNYQLMQMKLKKNIKINNKQKQEK